MAKITITIKDNKVTKIANELAEEFERDAQLNDIQFIESVLRLLLQIARTAGKKRQAVKNVEVDQGEVE